MNPQRAVKRVNQKIQIKYMELVLECNMCSINGTVKLLTLSPPLRSERRMGIMAILFSV